MTNPIDVAYVDIVTNAKSLQKMKKDIDKALDDVDGDVVQHLRKIDDTFDDTFKNIDDHFKKVGDEAEKVFDDVVDSVERSFNDVDTHIDRHDRRTRSRFSALGAAIGDTFEAAGRRITETLARVFSAVGGGLGPIFGAVGQLGGALGGFIQSSPMLALIVALAPAIIALVAALSQLIGLVGLLPSGLGVLVAAIIPTVIAFQNFGDAVSALASGDLEKIDEALKKLSPSARQVAREVAAALPVLRTFQRAIQESFFIQVRGSFTQIIAAIPQVIAGFGFVATAMGKLTKQFIDFLTSAGTIQVVNELFMTTARIIEALTGPVVRLFDAITSSVHESLPIVERLAVAFGNALDKFSAFLNKAIETGSFDQFIEDAITTVKELVDLVKALGGLLGTIFAGTEDAGHDFIQTLTDLTTRLDDFFKSAEGQDVLKDLVFLVKALGAVLGATVTGLIFLDQQFRLSLAVLEKVGRGFTDLVQVIGDFFGGIPDKFREVGAFLERIPGLIGQSITALFNTALVAIGAQIGLILFFVQELPGQIADFFSTLPERIGASLAATGPTILDIFRQAFADTNAFLIQKFDEVVAFIQSVPERIAALGPAFLRAGKNLITSFMNGFRAVGSFIGDIAGDIVGSVKSFLNRAIDKINSGIAAIDAVLPGELGRIPRLADGGIARRRAGGTLAVVGEGNEDEAIAPLSTLEDIIRKALGRDGPGSGMTVNFAPGAISVSFAGVVPTEAEARSVAKTVGDGIADQLAKRNVKTQVRAV